MFLAGCSNPQPGLDEIQSPDATQRVLAIRAAGEARDRRAVPLLVDRLEDEDDGVRFYAILALERITGKRLGYDYGASPGPRAAAVERWREFVRDGGHVAQASGRAGDNGTSVNGDGGSAAMP